MSLGPEDYREGATQRIGDAHSLLENQRWAGAVYLAGRGAQAMLRSLLVRKTGKLEVGHDLHDHLKQIRRLGILKAGEDDHELHDAVNELAILWRNDLRFTGAGRFRQLLSRVGRTKQIGSRRIKGDPEKPNAVAVVQAAETVVSRGELVWRRLKKN